MELDWLGCLKVQVLGGGLRETHGECVRLVGCLKRAYARVAAAVQGLAYGGVLEGTKRWSIVCMQ